MNKFNEALNGLIGEPKKEKMFGSMDEAPTYRRMIIEYTPGKERDAKVIQSYGCKDDRADIHNMLAMCSCLGSYSNEVFGSNAATVSSDVAAVLAREALGNALMKLGGDL